MLYVLLILLFSLLDAGITDFGLREHFIGEANPFAWHLYQLSPLFFYGWKIVLPLILLIIYPKIHLRKSIRFAIKVTCGLFFCLILYHGFWLTEILRLKS